MEHENYETHIKNWASSLTQLEENIANTKSYTSIEPSTHSALVVSTPTYYRSKAFSTSIGINNLINAADPLLTLATKLYRITIPPEATNLHQNLCHEIKAFEDKAQTFGYLSQLILAARYILCALLDELIINTLWSDLEWEKYSLIDTFHKESGENAGFFSILDRSLQDAAAYIDLLELIYISLRLGYEGKYRHVERGHLELRNITDHVYKAITYHREESCPNLLITLETPRYPHRKNNYAHLLPPTWLITAMMIIALATTFIFFYYKLVEVSFPISQTIDALRPQAQTT